MLNVSSLYFFVAMLKDAMVKFAAKVTPLQYLAITAAVALLLLLIRLVVPSKKRGKARGVYRVLIVAGGVLAAEFLYFQRHLLMGPAARWASRLWGIQSQNEAILLAALMVFVAISILLAIPYFMASRKPNNDSTLNRRQKLGLALTASLMLALLLVARLFAFAYFTKALLTVFVVAEVVNLIIWFYDPLIYLASRLIKAPTRLIYPPTPGQLNRLAIIVCAHNEEAVIGNLIESVHKNAYPRDRYDLFVCCDNCTDGTAKQASSAGALTMIRNDPEKRGKGYALQWMFDQLQAKRSEQDGFDAYIILDADNLVNERFLDAINNQLNKGYEIMQAYLGCKNPDDTWVSKAYALSYWLSNANYQDAHSRVGLSAQLGGTGMVIRPSVLDNVAWQTDTLTEDLVMTTNYVHGRRLPVTWVNDARLYDEKPLDFSASLVQRTRWMQGHMDEAMREGLPTLMRGIAHMSWLEIDVALYLLRPLLNFALFIIFLFRWIIAFINPVSPLNQGFLLTPASAALLVVFYLLMQVYALYREGYERSALWIPLSYVFAASWYLPILRGIVKRKERSWVSTAHTRSLSISEVKDNTTLDEAMARLYGIDNLHRMTLGQILVKSATITNEQLQEALDKQRKEGGHLGEIIVGMQVVSKETLDVYLALQQSLRDIAHKEELPHDRLRLGDLMVDANVITQRQLDEAMAHQRENHCLLGESLVSIKAMSIDMLDSFLNIQHVLDAHYLTPQRAAHLINGIMRESVSNLGMLLFAGGLISKYQLDVALAYQKERGGILGEIIVHLGFVSQEHINALLEIQKTSRTILTQREALVK